jgi:hypothetical protein
MAFHKEIALEYGPGAHSAVRSKISYLTYANLSAVSGSRWPPAEPKLAVCANLGAARSPAGTRRADRPEAVRRSLIAIGFGGRRERRVLREISAWVRAIEVRDPPRRVSRRRDASDRSRFSLSVSCLRAPCCVDCVGWPPPRGKFEPDPTERALEGVGPIGNEKVNRERPAGEAYPDALHSVSIKKTAFMSPQETRSPIHRLIDTTSYLLLR